MIAGSDPGGTAPVAAATRVAAPDPLALLSPKGELAAAAQRPAPRPSGLPPALPLAAAEPTTTRLSAAAQLLLTLVQHAGLAAPAPRAPSPLLSAPATDGATLAAALKGGVEASGLFYESHLADWVAGRRSLAAIRTEPQANLMQTHSAQASAAPEPTGAAPSAFATSADAAVGSHLPLLQAILSAQLDIIDSGQLRWQGELWPGMPVDIRLQRETREPATDEASQGQAAEAPAERRWQARLVADLPALGKVSTLFTLHADRLDVKLDCGQDGTALALQSAALQLADGLQAAGIALLGFASHGERG